MFLIKTRCPNVKQKWNSFFFLINAEVLKKTFIHYVWEKHLLFMLVLVGHNERSFSLQINITKDITSKVQWVKDFSMISLPCILLLNSILMAYSILVLTVNTQPVIACSSLAMEALEQYVGCLQGWWLCICMCMCVCMYVCIYVYIYIYICVCLCMCMYVYIYIVCLCVYISVCVCVYMYICYVYIYVSTLVICLYCRVWAWLHLNLVLLLLTLGK